MKRHAISRKVSLKIFFALAWLSVCGAGAGAQGAGEEKLEGFWSGAFVREGAVQLVYAEVRREDGKLRVELELPDRPFNAPAAGAVGRDAEGRLTFDTPHGPATLTLDPTFLEMVGTVGASTPPLRLHLKRAVRPPAPRVKEEEVAFAGNDGVRLSGTLVLPEGAGPHPAMIHVHGRGCQGRGGFLRRARVLARYGVAGLAFDKRGVGASEGSCERATIEEETNDVLAALDLLAGRGEIDRARIGAMGSSAGAWVVARASARASRAPLAFVVTSVGPATSVREQQLDNARHVSRDLKLGAEDERKLLRYVELMFDERGDPAAQFAEMRQLIAHGEQTGWAKEFLAPTDVAATPAEIKNLWVRRFNYDPRADLRRLRVPLLAFYGAGDRVVPPAENVPELRRLMAEAGNRNFRVVVIPEAGHGLVQDDVLRKLPGGKGSQESYYWKFGRLGAEFLPELLDFLRATLKLRM